MAFVAHECQRAALFSFESKMERRHRIGEATNHEKWRPHFTPSLVARHCGGGGVTRVMEFPLKCMPTRKSACNIRMLFPNLLRSNLSQGLRSTIQHTYAVSPSFNTMLRTKFRSHPQNLFVSSPISRTLSDATLSQRPRPLI
jgi:hypothetical protein